jgi:hypothetical protein
VDVLKGLTEPAGIKAAKALAPHLPPTARHAHLAEGIAAGTSTAAVVVAGAAAVTAAAAGGTGAAVAAAGATTVVVAVQTGTPAALPTEAERCQAAAAALQSLLLKELASAEKERGLPHLGLGEDVYREYQAALEADPVVLKAR